MFKLQSLLLWMVLLCKTLIECYQYKSFVGPVSGAIEEISVPYYSTGHPLGYIMAKDYIAKPDYSFGYGVDDELSGNTQNHHETRDGDVVTGEYSVVQPDGTLRVVSYTSDPENGFRAKIDYRPGAAPAYSPPPHAGSDTTSTYYDYY